MTGSEAGTTAAFSTGYHHTAADRCHIAAAAICRYYHRTAAVSFCHSFSCHQTAVECCNLSAVCGWIQLGRRAVTAVADVESHFLTRPRSPPDRLDVSESTAAADRLCPALPRCPGLMAGRAAPLVPSIHDLAGIADSRAQATVAEQTLQEIKMS